mgnify:FL=1
MATQGNQIRQTFVAGADLSGKQYTLVTCNGVTADGENRTVVTPAVGAKVDGVVINNPGNARAATVVVFGRTKVKAGGAIPAGAEVQTNANGQVIAATTGIRVGKALEAAVANQIITIDFYPGGNAA